MGVLEYTATIPAGKGARPQVSGLSYKIENGEIKDVLVNGETLLKRFTHSQPITT